LHTASRFARRLDGREKQTDQNADDRDNDQQFDQREAATRLKKGKRHLFFLFDNGAK
jgi:hypothetical protein